MVQGADSLTYDMLKWAVDASAAKGRVISNNIANINTPEFKSSSVSFEKNLNDIINGDSLTLKTTNSKHMVDQGDTGKGYKVEKDESTSMREDGNNVDVDKEMVDLSSNNMYYNFLISRINGQISSKRYIISEGRK